VVFRKVTVTTVAGKTGGRLGSRSRAAGCRPDGGSAGDALEAGVQRPCRGLAVGKSRPDARNDLLSQEPQLAVKIVTAGWKQPEGSLADAETTDAH
jgi:hypothetical protein